MIRICTGLSDDGAARRRLGAVAGGGLFHRFPREKLKKVFADHMINDSDIPEDMRRSKMVGPRVCYFAGGIVNLYKQWFRGDLDCTLNDIALEVSKLLQLEAKELL